MTTSAHEPITRSDALSEEIDAYIHQYRDQYRLDAGVVSKRLPSANQTPPISSQSKRQPS